MVRKLEFKDGIIEGTVVRELQSIFPRLEDSFRQRKTYDEYYYTETLIQIDCDRIEALNEMHYEIQIGPTDCRIIW